MCFKGLDYVRLDGTQEIFDDVRRNPHCKSEGYSALIFGLEFRYY